MSSLVAIKLSQLAGELEDLKNRLRVAVANELARHIATAVGDVIRAAVAGETEAQFQRAQFERRHADPDAWDDEEDSYDAAYRHREFDDDDEADQSELDRPVNLSASVAVAASVYVARWWRLRRRGTLLGAVGAGMGIGLLGLIGGPLVRSALVILAATGDLLSVTETVGAGASRLKQF